MFEERTGFILFVKTKDTNKDKGKINEKMRISGVNIPKEKRVVVSLTYVFGIGPSLSRDVLKEAKVDQSKRVKDLTDEEIKKVREIIEKKHRTEGELRRERRDSIERLKRIDSYRGSRHKKGLPARGQNTRTNNRTLRGNVRRVAGSGKKAPPAAK